MNLRLDFIYTRIEPCKIDGHALASLVVQPLSAIHTYLYIYKRIYKLEERIACTINDAKLLFQETRLSIP